MIRHSDSQYSPLSSAMHRDGNVLHDLDLSTDESSDAIESDYELPSTQASSSRGQLTDATSSLGFNETVENTLFAKKLTSQQRARRMLNGDDPWKQQRGACCCGGDRRSCTSASGRNPQKRGGLLRAVLTRGSHLALSTFVFTILVTHHNSPLMSALSSFYLPSASSLPDLTVHANNHTSTARAPAAVNAASLTAAAAASSSAAMITEPFAVVYVVLFFLALFLYFLTSLRNPGYLRPLQPDKTSPKGKFWNHYDGAGTDPFSRHRMPHDQNKPLLRECGFCGNNPPLRSRHCEDCGYCVMRYDHHCPWLDTCIGQENHAVFCWFLLVELIVLGASTYMNWKSMSKFVGTGWTFSDWLADNALLFINFVILIPSTSMVIGLLTFHTYLASVNSTTWEMSSRHRITYLAELEEDLEPFDAGIFCNLLQFCCFMTRCSFRSSKHFVPRLRWENQYLRAVAKRDEECALEMDAL